MCDEVRSGRRRVGRIERVTTVRVSRAEARVARERVRGASRRALDASSDASQRTKIVVVQELVASVWVSLGDALGVSARCE